MTIQAVSFGGSSRYTRAATGLGGGTDMTMAAWVKLSVDTDFYNFCLSIDNGGSNYVHIGTQADGTNLWIDADTGGSGIGLSATIGTWYYLAFTYKSAAADSIFIAASGTATLTETTSFNTSGPLDTGTFYIGSDGFGSNWNGSMACVRMWTAALTKTELEAEMSKVNPVRTANLWAAYSFQSGPQTTDESGNGRTLTVTGTPTADTSGPTDVITNFEGLTVTVAATITVTDNKTSPSGLYTDDFNRANTTNNLSGGFGLNGVNGDWSAPAWAISGNKATRVGSTGSDYATFRGTIGMPDMSVEADYDVTAGASCAVTVRSPTDANDETGYLGSINASGNATIGKVVAGTYTALTSTASVGLTTGRVRLEVSGADLTMKINGSTVQTVTDTSIVGGNYTGIYGSSGATIDNFAIGGITTPVVTTLYTPLVQFPLLPMGG